MLSSARARSILIRLAAYSAFVILWEVLVTYFNFGYRLIPTPSAVLRSLAANFFARYNIFGSTIVTFQEVLFGFVVALAGGLGIALLIASNDTVREVFYPILLLTQGIPKTAIAPLLILWFGHGVFSKVALVFLLSFFPIIVNGLLGLSSAEPELIDLMRIMRSSKLKIFTKVRIPNALPHIFAAIHIAVPLAVIGAVVGEFMASESGLGWLILNSTVFLEVALTFAVLILLVIITLALERVVSYVEGKLIPWHVTKRVRAS